MCSTLYYRSTCHGYVEDPEPRGRDYVDPVAYDVMHRAWEERHPLIIYGDDPRTGARYLHA